MTHWRKGRVAFPPGRTLLRTPPKPELSKQLRAHDSLQDDPASFTRLIASARLCSQPFNLTSYCPPVNPCPKLFFRLPPDRDVGQAFQAKPLTSDGQEAVPSLSPAAARPASVRSGARKNKPLRPPRQPLDGHDLTSVSRGAPMINGSPRVVKGLVSTPLDGSGAERRGQSSPHGTEPRGLERRGERPGSNRRPPGPQPGALTD